MAGVVDDGFDPPQELPIGRAQTDSPTDSAFAGVRAVLWLPDPEQRHWWREYYVRQANQPKPGGKLGF